MPKNYNSPSTQPNNSANSDAPVEDSFSSDFDPGAARLEEHYRQLITPESIRDYPKNRVKENVELLDRVNRPLSKVYQNLIHEFPSLARVKLNQVDFDPQRPNASFQAFNGKDHYFSSVQMDFAHPEIYTKPENLREGEAFGLERAIKCQALKIGVRPSDMMRDQNLINAFVFAHEMGHAYDFHRNYLAPKIAETQNPVVALPSALGKYRTQRRRDMMTMPIPSHVKEGSAVNHHAFNKRLRALGIDPDDQERVLNLQARSYREMTPEARADNFAAAYVMRHLNDFFSTPERPDPSKIPTHFGEIMNISKDVDLLGLDPGRAVELVPLELNDNQFSLNQDGHLKPNSSLSTICGFLADPISKDRPISLYREGTLAPSDRFPDSAPLNGIFIRPLKDPLGRVENEIILTYNSPKTHQLTAYLAKIDSNREPPEISVSPDEMMRELDLAAGSKVQLMKRRLHDDSRVGESAILGGELYRPDYWSDSSSSPIELGHGIHLRRPAATSDHDPSYFTGGNTSGIQRIYRKWRSYFIETMTSTYEVLPYED